MLKVTYTGASPTGGSHECTAQRSSRSAEDLYYHDANGNDNNVNCTWMYNSANQPTHLGMTGFSGDDNTLAYRGGGLSELVREGGSVVRHNVLGIGGRGSTQYVRAADGTVLSQRPTSGERRNFLYDGAGSVTGLTDAGGTVRASYGYEPYGHPLQGAVGNDNPFGFLGGYTYGGEGVRKGLCGPPMMLPGADAPHDTRAGRYTSYSLPAVGVSPNYSVNVFGRRERQQAADGLGFRGVVREIYLRRARTDPAEAAGARRLAQHYNPVPKPDRAVGLDDVAGVFTVRRVLEAIGGCVGTAGAGAYYGAAVGSPVAGAVGGCLAGGLAAVFGGNLVQPWRSGQPG